MAGITAKNKNKVLEPKLASSTLFNNSNLSSHMETLPNQPTTMLDKFIEALLMSPNTYLLGFSMQPRCVTAFVGLREGGYLSRSWCWWPYSFDLDTPSYLSLVICPPLGEAA